MARGPLFPTGAKGRAPGHKEPEYQIIPIITKKNRSTRVGTDFLRGVVTRVEQKGVQVSRQKKQLSSEGGFSAPYEAATIFNWQTTYKNEAVSKGWTPDELLEKLKAHPANFHNRARVKKYFYLKVYEPEITEEEEELLRASVAPPIQTEKPISEHQMQSPFGMIEEPVPTIPVVEKEQIVAPPPEVFEEAEVAV